MIIGLSLGVSQSPCTMKPLIVALSFHQFFEGFALYLVLLLGLVLLQFLTLTIICYCLLFLGAGFMSSLAIWA
ncbi:hypothetical protein GYH30_039520 [Glycine max]|nr:hypothetical protein GYH30_039520 [Glycine max]